ncbi:hypothetical protein [Roseomonas sp. 18066]|uniref:hypothetical protein n=1 Tax=Roseomonas sp. 18066 TaxID=2681412 RepID=UPI001356D178|nr:hypothetical protein [Roseomonas sp. 18066]
MTLTQILDTAALLLLLAAQAGWILLLYRRMGRLRAALEGAAAVIAQLDEASRRLDASAGGIVQKVRDGIAEVDSKINACRRVAQELNAASRQAEDIAAKLDQSLRQNRKLQQARAAAPPRELVEPLGLAERLSERGPAPVLTLRPEPAPALVMEGHYGTALLEHPGGTGLHVALLDPPLLQEQALEKVLAAELCFAHRDGPGVEPRTIRVKLD